MKNCISCGKKLYKNDLVLTLSTPFGLNYYCSEECMVNYVLEFHNTSKVEEEQSLR